MKTLLALIAAGSMFGTIVVPVAAGYRIIDLGTLGGASDQVRYR